MKVFNLLGFLSSFGLVSYAQEQHPVKSKEPFRIQGTLGLLSFWMSRSYREGFKSVHALGQSAYIRMNAKIYQGFYLAGKHTVFGNVTSSDLTVRNTLTGNLNRYEGDLFDLNPPGDKFFGKLEELQLRFGSKKFSAIARRMPVNTPFVNPQDGRLSPAFVEGISRAFKPDPKNQVSADFI